MRSVPPPNAVSLHDLVGLGLHQRNRRTSPFRPAPPRDADAGVRIVGRFVRGAVAAEQRGQHRFRSFEHEGIVAMLNDHCSLTKGDVRALSHGRPHASEQMRGRFAGFFS